ncbi:hypothetical protein CK203_061266 [Vitis vinifera]|uniref:Transposon Ty3-I Gag-Pol polyprotein n=1 Tax=Vitis vinifera TaxID=29760 RepID=A0A438G5B6_VITVI|nr:hypothetical protein CK203_061266 [Vitis vinifera]
MADLFRRANKYSMLEDDVRAATQQVLVAGRPSRGEAERNAKPPDRPRPSDRRQEGPSRPDRPPTTPLSILYEKLLPMIQGLSDFRWPRPQGTDHPQGIIVRDVPSTRNTVTQQKHAKEAKIVGGPHQYANASIPSAWASWRGPSPIDGTIIFPPVDPTRTLQPHRDTLILSLEIGDFDVRRILVDPGSSADLVQASVVSHMGHSLVGLENPGRILSGFNGSSTMSLEILYCRSKLASHSHVQFSWYKSDHPSISSWARMATLHESHPLYISSNDPSGRKLDAFTPDRQKVIRNEINKLLESGFIREVAYLDWLANVVVVPKKKGKWWVCVDYTNLNNACPKDSFSLPRIDQIVDSTSGQGMLFLGCLLRISPNSHVPG